MVRARFAHSIQRLERRPIRDGENAYARKIVSPRISSTRKITTKT